MSPSFFPRGDLGTLLDRIQRDFAVFAPVRKGERRYLQRLSFPLPGGDASSLAVGEVRTVEPLKSFFFAAKEVVSRGFDDALPSARERPACVVGAKACDLAGLAVLDKVFLEGDYRDPSYDRRRRETLIVSADCTFAIDTCFCTALAGSPHPNEGFDLNLSEVDGGFVAEPGSERGRDLLKGIGSPFAAATAQQLADRDNRRKLVREEVRSNVRRFGVPDRDSLGGVVQRGWEAPIWKDEGARCVECGACNTICPTCHCFLLADQSAGGIMGRLRLWDSCLIKDFARVAGGANPRPYLWMRLRNRFEKKFDFFPKTASLYACTGCGRCISACPGRIDIRKVLKGLVEHVPQRESVPTG